MKRKIVKAEILWTRKCPLKCEYCAMADGRKNTVSLKNWVIGFDNLKTLGCSFAAFYGAEPLEDFKKLPSVIQYAESIGIHTTVITSSVTSSLEEKLKTLYDYGLRSITTSFDEVSDDKSSQIKSSKALETIEMFRSFGPIRDSAVVVTLTRANYKNLPSIVTKMTGEGIWTFFDFIHPDRGQPGSKVKNANPDLLFGAEDLKPLLEVLQKCLELKDKGYLFHTSKEFVDMVKLVFSYASMYHVPNSVYRMWNCARHKCFPSWVTVDCDGIVYPCDDFQPKTVLNVPIWELASSWHDFSKSWKASVLAECPGCLWNTHIDSHYIKLGFIPITNYVHGITK